MTFLDWCSGVMEKFFEAYADSGIYQTTGLDALAVAKFWWGPDVITSPDWHKSKRRMALLAALRELADAHLLDETATRFYRPSEVTRMVSSSEDLADLLAQMWASYASTELKARDEKVLAAIEQLSHEQDADFPDLNRVPIDAVDAALQGELDREAIFVSAQTLDELRLISWTPTMGMHFTAYITYRGLVRLLKRDFTIVSQEIDELLKEWETTSVEFKREVRTDTADEKAEFIKDILALANTQASGRRWLIVGFDNQTHVWSKDPDRKLTQDHIEQLLSMYAEPMIQTRYEMVDYRAGKVGRLEVLREQTNLPYRVRRSIGDRKRITAGQIFVRHGSQIEEPTPLELQALEGEATRARAQ